MALVFPPAPRNIGSHSALSLKLDPYHPQQETTSTSLLPPESCLLLPKVDLTTTWKFIANLTILLTVRHPESVELVRERAFKKRNKAERERKGSGLSELTPFLQRVTKSPEI